MKAQSDFENMSDHELVRSTLEDADNYVHLMNRYEERLLRYIRRISSATLEDAEDTLQEVFIKAYQNLNGFDDRQKFSSWIYRIAHNQTISNFRKAKARPESAFSLDDDENVQEFVSDMQADDGIDSGMALEDIRRVMNSLDPKYREVLVLKYFEDKDYDEISTILHKPKGTVGTLLNRARAKCKEAMKHQQSGEQL